MSHDSAGQAGAHQDGEIEITEEMADAGRDIILTYGEISDPSRLAEQVYTAMALAGNNPPFPPPV
jgi:hypothetical protein